MEREIAVAAATAEDRQLQELSGTESWQLVESGHLGRLAWAGPQGITIVPVNYSLDGDTILVRTSAYSSLARECDDSPVAFEVDQHDPLARAGWSVLVRGVAHVDFDVVAGAPGAPGVDVWPSGPRPLHLRVEPTQITGRRLRP